MMRVGAAVLAYGDGPYERVVRALLGAGLSRDQILVVQNPRMAGEPTFTSEVTVLRMAQNRGYGAAMNAAITRLLERGDELVLLLTHDSVITAHGLDALLKAAGTVPSLGAVGPVISFTGPTSQEVTYGGVQRPGARITHYRSPTPWEGHPELARCEWIDGCAMLLRARALEQAGLFDEDFFMYYEDTELCLRIRRAGWEIAVALDAGLESQAGKHRRPGAAAFLFSRNSLEFHRRVGSRALAGEIAWQLRQLLTPGRDLIAPRGRWTRSHAASALTGMLCGWVAFTLRRFGPPPQLLPGLGDVAPPRDRTPDADELSATGSS